MWPVQQPDRRHRLTAPAIAALAALAAGLAAYFGTHSDQMIPARLAVRALGGQSFLVDYESPIGPLAGWLFVPFVALLPTLGWAMIAGAAALNGAVALMVWLAIRRLSGDHVAAAIGGALSAIVFVPPFGAFYFDHLAYAFIMAAGVVAVLGHARGRWLILAGIFCSASLFTKLTVGAFGSVALGLTMLLLARPLRSLGWIAMGGIAGLIVIGGLVIQGAGFEEAYAMLIEMPRRYAGADRDLWQLPLSLIDPFNTPLLPGDLAAAYMRSGVLGVNFLLVALVVYGLAAIALITRGRTRALLVFALVSTAICGALLGRAHFHRAFGLPLAIGLGAAWLGAGAVRRATALGAAVAVAAVISIHALAARQGPWLAAPGELRPLLMQPGDYEVDPRDLLTVIDFLAARPGPVAIFDEMVSPIALALGRAPIEPSLWFHQGLTPAGDPTRRARWEQHYIARLEAAPNADVVMTQGPSHTWRMAEGELAQVGLPLLHQYITTHFRPVLRAGRIVVLARLT